MSTIQATLLMIFGGLGVLFFSWHLLEDYRINKYENKIKVILRKNDCPLYNHYEIIECYRRGDNPNAVANLILAEWNNHSESN